MRRARCPGVPLQPIGSFRARAADVRHGTQLLRAARCMFAALVIAAAPQTRANPPCVGTVAVLPDQPAEATVTLSGLLLLEEVGVDVEYRWHADEPYTAIDTPPDRLGFAPLTPRTDRLSLRVREGQGGGLVRLISCLDEADVSFYVGLAELQRRSLEKGAENARIALTTLDYLQRWPLATHHAGWVGSARANALASAGDNLAAEAASLHSSRLWQEAGRPDRAAIATMAAGESAARGGRFADAQRLLSKASAALHELDVGYYALRSESALCYLLSRQHHYRAAIDCELRVIPQWHERHERREAALREISVGNLWLSLHEPERAEPHFINAQKAAAVLSPIVLSRLESSIGTYRLQRGDLPGAAQSLARAAQQLGNSGLPFEQNNLDLKLANLAQLAGAVPERIRLLEAAVARLPGDQDPQRAANARLGLSQARLDAGDVEGSMAAAETADELCRKVDDRNCRDRARLSKARALILQRQSRDARELLAELSTEGTDTNAIRQLLAARCDLLDGAVDQAWKLLQTVDAKQLTPDDEVELVQTRMEALRRLGNPSAAVPLLEKLLEEQATQIANWPSAALRLSALNRLAKLQAIYFDAVLDAKDSRNELDPSSWARLLTILEQAGIQRLFARRADAQLAQPLRSALAGMIAGTSPKHQRAVFSALADAAPVASGLDSGSATAISHASALDNRDIVLLPLAGQGQFHLLLWHGGRASICLRQPVEEYNALVRRFDAALDGIDEELLQLQQEAERWHALVRTCSALHEVQRWHVVASTGAATLPWTWIAAAGHGAEPALTTTFSFPAARAPRLERSKKLVLFDLDMPTVAPLPLASSELETLHSLALANGIATQRMRAAELPAEALLHELAAAPAAHIVGHANPASFGQLYQGLWYEAERKPMLLTYPEIASLQSRSELIVLSACGTRASDPQRYGAAARLAEAWIAAGARHVVAASNPLSDAAAPIWTRRFYETLWRSGDAAAAARDARALLRRSPHFRHPKFWAGIDYYAAMPVEKRAEADTLSSSIPQKGD